MLAEITIQVDPAGIIAALTAAVVAVGGLIATLRAQRHTKRTLTETKGELSETKLELSAVKKIVQGNGKGDMTQMLETIIDAVEDVKAKADEVKRTVDIDRELAGRRAQNLDDQLVGLGRRVDGISRHQREDRVALGEIQATVTAVKESAATTAVKVDQVVADTEKEIERLRTETMGLVLNQLAEKFPLEEREA